MAIGGKSIIKRYCGTGVVFTHSPAEKGCLPPGTYADRQSVGGDDSGIADPVELDLSRAEIEHRGFTCVQFRAAQTARPSFSLED
jgi:hypothetical protein